MSRYRAESGRREIVPLLGNHDVPYLMQHGSASFARVRAQAPGFKPGAQRRVHELMKDIPIRIAWTDGTIIATHAGLTRRWGIRRFGHAWTGMTADRIAARLNRLPDRPGSLAALYMDDDGPLWARPGHGDYDGRLTQVSWPYARPVGPQRGGRVAMRHVQHHAGRHADRRPGHAAGGRGRPARDPPPYAR